MLLEVGNWGYQIGAVGIVAFTVAFLILVRWWTDLLGRLFAGVLVVMSGVLIMSTIRMLNIDLPGDILIWRLAVFWAFGLGVWTALGAFVWAQFLAPRIRKTGRMTTRREFNEPEGNYSSPGSRRDGDSHDHSGRVH